MDCVDVMDCSTRLICCYLLQLLVLILSFVSHVLHYLKLIDIIITSLNSKYPEEYGPEHAIYLF